MGCGVYKMNSWDCFDTLVARRFYHPHSIFEEVEKRFNIPGFVKRRKQLEKQNTLTYDQMYEILNDIDPSLEFSIELEHCFGIVENLNKVQDGDLIISDMYLSEKQVRKILEKCGLTKDVKIIVTVDGKKTGTIWPTVSGINEHIGDNIKSDVYSPMKFGIKGTHYTDCFFNDVENEVSTHNYNLACWMRYLRLRCPYSSERDKMLWNDQANLNLPLLALATLELPDNKNIAFSYRDCAYWHRLYTAMTGKDGIRLDVSRICYASKKEEFVKYVYDSTKDALIVDLMGTGDSVNNFFNGGRDILYVIAGSNDMKNIKFLSPKVKNSIERHNCTTLGPLIDWDNGPIRGICEHDIAVANLQDAAATVAAESINYFYVNKDVETLKYLSSLMPRNYTHNNVRYEKG